MASIFISYDRGSKALVITLAADIESLGHTVWFDQEISGGRAWWDQILEQIRVCDVFVLVLNLETLASVACKSEYMYAADLGKAILPLLVSDQVAVDLLPPTLSRIQFVDYRTADRDAAFRLARALNSIPPSQPLPEILPTPPLAPISYLGSLAERVESTSLSYEEQSVLLADLRMALRDPEATDQIEKLLATLRKRRDLFATFAEEADDLIAKSGKLRSERVDSQQPEETSPNVLDPLLPTLSSVKEVDSVRAAFRRLRWPQTRLGASFRGAIFGCVVVVLYLGLAGVYSSEPFFFKFITLLAIAGAILGKKGWASLVAGLLVVGIMSLGTLLQKPGYESAIGSGSIAVLFAIMAQTWSWIYALIARLR